MSELYLAAYLANAQDEAETVVTVATCNVAEEWHSTDGHRIWPFWTEALVVDIPTPPEGWVDYLIVEAQAFAAKQRDARRPTGLQALLAAKAPPPPAPAPIPRRGF